MKKLFLLLSFSLFGLLFAGCSSEDVITSGEEPSPSEDVARNYLSITLNTTGTRAATGPDENDDFVDGTKEENAVNFVRFFFFDEKGNAAPVRQKTGTGGYNSFIDWYPTNDDTSGSLPSESVEKVLTATLSISTPDHWGNPAKVVAILNPTSEVLELTTGKEVTEGTSKTTVFGPSLSDLRNIVADFKTGLMNNNFVMSNSVYVYIDETDETKKDVVYATELTDDNFKYTIEDAEANKVVIYVERVLARLDLYTNITNTLGEETKNIPGTTTTLYPVWKEKITNVTTADGIITKQETEQVLYIKLLGWNITATPNVSRLEKEVSSSWTNESLFKDAAVWNSPKLFHRSFWALNPNHEDNSIGFKYLYGNFNGTAASGTNDYPAIGLPMPTEPEQGKPQEPVTVYLQENANKYSNDMNPAAPGDTTKVIIAAQLTDENGQPYPLVEWGYKKYTLEGLKTEFASTVLNNLYNRKTENGVTVYTKIKPCDITFKTAAQIKEDQDLVDSNLDDEADYYVYAVLTDEAKALIWTLGEGENAPEYENAAAVNAAIRDAVKHVKAWGNEENPGLTYYFFNIKHLGGEGSPGEYGIVRNHVYQATITSIEGLGTPVYDPDQTIYPEIPETDESIMSATVKILRWRIVEDSYDLTWPK